MATNFIQEGKVIPFTAGAAYSSGDVVVLGGLIGVVLDDVANGAVGQASICGVFDLPKVSAADLSVGKRVQYDVSAGEIADSGATPESGDLVNCGTVFEAADNTATTVRVLINVPGADITA